jgi:hypothetical protein
MTLFSRRNAVADRFRYDLPENVRSRILHTMDQCMARHCQTVDFNDMLYQLGHKLEAQYGGLNQPGYRAARRSDHPVIEHFLCSEDELALDFIQLAFQTLQNCGGQPTVEAINRIFEEEGIGYELTPLLEIPVDPPSRSPRRGAGKEYRLETPRIIQKDEQLLHRETVQPCLRVLGDPRFSTANHELLDAFEKIRKGAYADAITSAGSAIESVLKTICALKGWPHNPEKDTCSRLLDICRDNGLFPGFYKVILEATATIRNKLGDAHGRGPSSQYAPTREHAEHMLHVTAANIVLLVGLAQV